MQQEMHVVLGGSGAIGQAVIQQLQSQNKRVIAVERSKRIANVVMRMNDLLDLEQARQAVAGATHVYICIGLPYETKIWQEQWPKIIENLIIACESEQAKVIFFDNIYMYGPAPLKVPFNEAHPQQPDSQKGKVRKQVADLLLAAHEAGRIQVVIGRSADFYGPNAHNSALYTAFLARMLKGKNPQVLAKTTIPHTYAYTLDNGRALVALALDETAYGQVWHLPVCAPLTIDEVVQTFNELLGTHLRAKVMSKPMQQAVGLVVPLLHEAAEMGYQLESPYIMDAHKFHRHFPDFKVTPFNEGAKMMVASFQTK